MIWLFAFLLSAQAQIIQSDCSASEQKALQSPEFINQFVLQGSLSGQDCTPVKLPDKELLLINVVASTLSGTESYIALYNRPGFNEKSAALFKSFALGFDTFPILVKNAQRLVFVLPSSDKNKLVLYLVLQTGPAAVRLGRWEYSYATQELHEVTTRVWGFEAGVMAKVYEDKDAWRALIEVRSVEL